MSQESSHKFKRINVLVRSDQYEKVNEVGLNMSGLIRGLLDDHFGDQRRQQVFFGHCRLNQPLTGTVNNQLGRRR